MILFILGAIVGWVVSHFSSIGLALALPAGLWLKRYLTWPGFIWAAVGLQIGTLFVPMNMFIGGVSHNNFFTTLVVINAVGVSVLWLIGGLICSIRQGQRRRSDTKISRLTK